MIYLDGTATTKPTDKAIRYYNEICQNHWLNPSSTTYSTDAAEILCESRQIIANWLDCKESQVYFTSGSTESANWVIQTFAPRYDETKNYCFCRSKMEHPAVRNSLNFMERCGYEVSEIENDHDGMISYNDLAKWNETNNIIGYDKWLACIMDSNNQIGTINPTHDIAELIHEYPEGYLMTDMTQSFAHAVDIDMTWLNCDFAFGSGQKFGAPRGTGILYIKNPEIIDPFIYGGKQENGLRGGTENLAGIYAMAVQFDDTASMRFANNEKMLDLRKYLFDHLPNFCIVNNDFDDVLPNIISLRTPMDGQSLVAAMAMEGIYISSGSACSTGSKVPSPTLKAIGLTDEEAAHTVRISLEVDTTKKDIDTFVKTLDRIITLIK